MRRLAVVLGVLVLLLAVAVAADLVVRSVVERRATAALTETTGLVFSADAEVSFSGFPFLTQLASGRLTEATVTAGSVVVDGVELLGVEANARGLGTTDPYHAQEATLVATAPPATLTDAVARSRLGELGFEVAITVEGGDVVARTRVLGLPVAVAMQPEPAGKAVGVGLESFTLAGFTVSADDLPRALRDALDGLEIPLTGLPEGLEVREVDVVADGLRVGLAGQDLDLAAVAAAAP